MVFNSLLFFIFLPFVLLLYAFLPKWRDRKMLLLLASYLFYAGWHPPFVLLLLISTAADWKIGRYLEKAETLNKRRFFLLLSLSINLGLLSYFKYATFFLESLQNFTQQLGFSLQVPQLSIALPVGISFYTFQTLSYSIDIYKKNAKAWSSLLDFSLFVAFFPQLVAGPIVRAVDFEQQCLEQRSFKWNNVAVGLILLLVGIFQKIVLADAILSLPADILFNTSSAFSMRDAWFGTFAFSGQIYFDFAGYSLAAIGVAHCFGFTLPLNFHAPYAALGFSDFWRRWHISLSTWLRDYLYISLGGNRAGELKKYRNLMITMLLGGLWHGASWRFVFWGFLHGLFLILEQSLLKYLPMRFKSTPFRVVGYFLTFIGVCITWVFFRATSFDAALHILKTMFTFNEQPSLINLRFIIMVSLTLLTTLATHHIYRKKLFAEEFFNFKTIYQIMILVGLIMAIIFSPGSNNAFIYFQF